jgi:hypothetical protein
MRGHAENFRQVCGGDLRTQDIHVERPATAEGQNLRRPPPSGAATAAPLLAPAPSFRPGVRCTAWFGGGGAHRPQPLAVGVHALPCALRGVHVEQAAPLSHGLIVEQNVGLGEVGDEARFQAHLHGTLPRVVCAAGTPAVEHGTLRVKIPHVLDGRGHGHAPGAEGADQRVVDVYVDDQGTSLLHWDTSESRSEPPNVQGSGAPGAPGGEH